MVLVINDFVLAQTFLDPPLLRREGYYVTSKCNSNFKEDTQNWHSMSAGKSNFYSGIHPMKILTRTRAQPL